MEPRLQPGSKGAFNVTVGNDLIFSKHEEGRFPDEREIVEAIRERAAAEG